MNTNLNPPTTRTTERAATANAAARMVFPSVAEHGDAFWEVEHPALTGSSQLEVRDLNENFWALTLGPWGTPAAPIVFATSEGKFRRYNPASGIFELICDATVMGEILDNLELCADFFPLWMNPLGYLNLKNRNRLKGVVERAKDALAVSEDYFKDGSYYHLALRNGLLEVGNQEFTASAPTLPIRDPLPVKYDPKTKCETFLNGFLRHILSPEDIDLLQRYCSQLLQGFNHSQTLLLLTGEAGWGKSTLMKVLGSVIGWNRVGVIREQLFRDEFELAHYGGKHLLYHPDMPTDFLYRKESSIFKQLVGGDPIWANLKGDTGRGILHGHFPVIMACNGKPRIHIDQDTEAWKRRLAVISFHTPAHERHVGRLADIIIKTEASGVLNWLLEGRAKLRVDRMHLNLTAEQEKRVANLLMGSDSAIGFLRDHLIKREGSLLSVTDLYAHYEQWCAVNSIRPVLPVREFGSQAREHIALTTGFRFRHDLGEEQGQMSRRGWIGLAVRENPKPEKVVLASAESANSNCP